MPSFKINFALCKGLAGPGEIVSAMEAFGFAESEEVGVLHAESAPGAAFGTIIRRTNLTFQKIDPATREVLTDQVEKVALLPFGAFPERGLLEVYEGSQTALKQVGEFFASALGMAVVTDEIPIDLLAAIEHLTKNTRAFQLKAARTGEYAANSYMMGPYAPKFADSDHGLNFLNQYEAALKTVQVRFAAANAKANITLRPNACFSYSCHEDDQAELQQLLRQVALSCQAASDPSGEV